MSFAHEGSHNNIFEDVSFHLDTDWRLGFIGRNGRGKTTFLKLLLGEHEFSGTIRADVNFEYFPYGIVDAEQLAIEALEPLIPQERSWELLREMSMLKLDEEVLYRSFSTLSNGEQTKLLLATLFLKDNCFPLIDEPTNHLDFHTREIVAQYLRSKKGFILVSHDRYFLDSCVDHILSINRADIEVQRGNYSTWAENKRLRDEFELAENERLKGDIRRLKDAAQRASDWSERVEASKRSTRSSGLRPDTGFIGHKSAKMMKRSKSLESRSFDALERKSSLLKNIETADSLKLSPLTHHANCLVSLENIAIRYGEFPICEGISFEITRGDCIALNGANGSGKSSIIKLICGENIPHSGNVRLASGLKISYVQQDASALSGSLFDYAEGYSIEETLFFAILRKLGFERTQFEKNLSDFSAGQKKKVTIARSLCENAHLYIWDEPLNYIDLLSRIQIEQLLIEYKPSLLFIEHDRLFTEKLATKTVEL